MEFKLVHESLQEYLSKNATLFQKLEHNFKFTCDDIAIRFLQGKINENQLLNYIFDDINEGIKESFINSFKKVLNVLYTLLLKAKQFGVKVVSKVIKIIDSILNKVQSFKEKHPALYRAIIIFVIIIILLILSMHNASAAEITDNKLQTSYIDMCNAAEAWIEHNKTGLTDYLQKHNISGSNILFEAKAYIEDMKDGKFDDPLKMSQEGIKLGKAAMESVNDLVKTANDTNDKQLMKDIISLIQKGSQNVWSTIGGKI